MSKRQLKSGDEEGMLRAYRDELFDLADEYDCGVRCSLVVPVKQGGLGIHLVAFRVQEDGSEKLLATFYQQYPSHVALTLPAAFYRAMVRLGIELRDKAREAAQSDGQPT